MAKDDLVIILRRLHRPAARGEKFVQIAFLIAIVNFLAFVIVGSFLGGDALNGHQEGGRYFLANHGKLTETSRAVFIYSKIHAISLFVTHPLAIFSVLIKAVSKR